ncbi:Uncharacterized membrane protein HdeD, DUF308 family [Tessaracoccus bendigoensis DSM 12906]|uniref:Uncharacterized membrane protein HdeD, DUF308 family n=1 Tax=Tessaracoccus bendigoensis DSM 12906 TaxID=1123357 RepID=A0A1M6E2I1_9ACTN|nr:DUF308 domain-containing protein [Tessaracoccus bendigoensis]SHI79707.1 Uncharacterized membrane protein HdeD, DUF308 family [Tessaracoccus bendigoensis DSM 12906]
MSTNRVVIDLDEKATSVFRAIFGFGGLLALVMGILILVWPAKTAMVVAVIIAIWALIAALVSLATGIFSKNQGTWARVGNIVVGVLLAAAAIFTFANLGTATAWLAALVGIVVGISWIAQGIIALTLLGGTKAKLWTLLYAALSIIAGVVLLFSPLLAVKVLFILIGVSFVVLGIAQLARAFRFGAN